MKYNEFKSLWKELANFDPKSKEAFEEGCQRTLVKVDHLLKALEENSLIGRWVRRFLESEFQNCLDRMALDRHLIEPKSVTETDCITQFWQEIDFCYEGFFTLDRFKDYDVWLCSLLIARAKRAFTLIKPVKFQQRLDHLKVSRDAYQKKLIQLLDGLVVYQQKTKGKIRPILIGQGKDDLTEILVRSPQGDWIQLTTREGKDFYETDLIKVEAKEDKKVILRDRRYIELEAGSIVVGWELELKIPAGLLKEIDRLIEQLGNDDWRLREDATEELIKIGQPALPAVQAALKHQDPEIRMRADYIFKKTDTTPLKEFEQQVRAIVKQAVNQGSSREYAKQLLQLGESEQILSIMEKIKDESQGNRRYIEMLKALIRMQKKIDEELR